MLSMIHKSMPGGIGLVRINCVISKPLASLPWITPISSTGRPPGVPSRYAVMSRPSTDWPSTRVSSTGDRTVVEVVVDVEDVVVVSAVVDVDDVVELVVDGEVGAGVVDVG